MADRTHRGGDRSQRSTNALNSHSTSNDGAEAPSLPLLATVSSDSCTGASDPKATTTSTSRRSRSNNAGTTIDTVTAYTTSMSPNATTKQQRGGRSPIISNPIPTTSPAPIATAPVPSTAVEALTPVSTHSAGSECSDDVLLREASSSSDYAVSNGVYGSGSGYGGADVLSPASNPSPLYSPIFNDSSLYSTTPYTPAGSEHGRSACPTPNPEHAAHSPFYSIHASPDSQQVQTGHFGDVRVTLGDAADAGAGGRGVHGTRAAM